MIDLTGWADSHHYKIAWGDIRLFHDSLTEFQIMSSLDQLNGLQSDKLAEWSSCNYEAETRLKTIILIAYSTSGKTREIVFDFDGMRISALIPPCYGDDGLCWQYEMTIENSLADYLSKSRYQVTRLSGPYKNLAARLGLGKYGRNNLIYVDGFGSYLRLIGFITDVALTPEVYPGANGATFMLENCKKCKLCTVNCPTQAIGTDRFLLHVDRCLAYHNEKVEEWPGFIKFAENRCLVGCITCQNICPYNHGFTNIGTIVAEQFNSEETGYIMGKTTVNEMESAESVFTKLAKLGLSRYQEYILRNIRAHINIM